MKISMGKWGGLPFATERAAKAGLTRKRRARGVASLPRGYRWKVVGDADGYWIEGTPRTEAEKAREKERRAQKKREKEKSESRDDDDAIEAKAPRGVPPGKQRYFIAGSV
jgi:hypothetical protein